MAMPSYAELLNIVHQRQADDAEPNQWFEYRVGPDGTNIERYHFAPDTVLGVGTFNRHSRDRSVCIFHRPSEKLSAIVNEDGKRRSVKIEPNEQLVSMGRLHARIISREVLAYPIDPPEAEQ